MGRKKKDTDQEELEVFDSVDEKEVSAKHAAGNPYKIDVKTKDLEAISKALSRTNFYTPGDQYDSNSKWISTGCTILNLDLSSIAYGGIQANRLTQIYGLPSTYKSALAYSLLANAQKLGYCVYYFDVEGTYNPDIALQYGLDVNNGLTFKLTTKLNGIVTVEDFFDSYLKNLVDLHTPEQPALLVVDTFSMLNSDVEERTKMGDEVRLGVKAKALSRGFKTYLHKMVSSGITIVSIDQVTDNLKMSPAMFQKEKDKYVVVGGHSIKFNATTRIFMSRGRNITNSTKQVTGVWVKYEITKNKNIPSDVRGMFLVHYKHGIDNIASNLVYLKTKQLDESKALTPSAAFSCLEQKGTLKDHYARIVSEGLQKELEEEVTKSWNDVRKESGGIV
jgi:recombination protein RecA